MTTNRVRARISRRGGMGNLLAAPGYPTHHAHVETAHVDKIGRIHCWADGGSMSIDYAATEDADLPEWVRNAARKMIEDWRAARPSLDAPEVQAWIAHCLGYFRGCYRNPDAPEGREWYADKMIIDKSRDPIAFQDDHAAVHCIRKFYPEYQLTAADLERAHWGDHNRVGCVHTEV